MKINNTQNLIIMKKLLTLCTVFMLSVSLWAADVSYSENFSKVGNVNNGTSDLYGDLCTWHRTLASHRAQDTILSKTRRAFLLPVAYAGSGQLETKDWEGGIKKVEFKYGRFGSENKDGRVLQLNVKAGTIQNPTPTFAKNAMKLSTGTTPQGYETYSFAFNCKEDAQLVISNISIHTEAPLASDASICRILVADIVITPYILYTQKEATIGMKQQGYVNQELLKNSEDAVTYSSDDESIAKVDPATGVVTPVSAGDVLIYAALAEGAKTHYTLHVVNNIMTENFSRVVQTGSASDVTWHGDLFDWKANAVRRGANDTIKSRLIERQQGTWFSKDGYIQTSAAVEGGIKSISFKWRQWSAKADGTTTKVSVSYNGEEKAYQEFANLVANTDKTFNEDINCASNAVLKIQNTSYTTGSTTTVNNRIVIENVKITPYLLYTTKVAALDTRNGLTYTNNDLINNTSGSPVSYSILPAGSGAAIDAEGTVTATDETEGDFTITAAWGAVETTYILTIMSRTTTTAAYSSSGMHVGLDAIAIVNPLTYTDSYDGTIAYSSSNTSVAEINPSTGAITVNGVGQTTITATLPQTENYKAAKASYTLYVRNNNGARIERFSTVSQSGIVGNTLTNWTGDLFTWQAQYQVRRGTNDTIHAGTTKHQGTSIGVNTSSPAAPSILQTKDAIEGGIKYLSFYWMQWGAASSCTRRIVVYADGTKIGEQEHPNGTAGKTGDEFLLGINNAMQSNKQLIIKNESYKGTIETLADNACRIVLDNIHITPYLLYTTKEAEMDMRVSTTFTNNDMINNTDGGTIVYSLEDNDEEATIDENSGEVTALKAGEVTVVATWNEGGAFTKYTLTIVSITETSASYANAAVRLGLGGTVDNELTVTDGYDGTIAYASSNTAVATVAADGTVSLAGGVGMTTITATLPATDNFTGTSASYDLYVTDNNARIEAFSQISGYKVSDIETNPLWNGDLYQWRVANSVRRNNDKFASDDTRQGTWMGTPENTDLYGILQTEEVIEGGIKHLSFYWEQPANTSEVGYTLKPAVYIKSGETETFKHAETLLGGSGDYIAAHRMLFGISNVMRTNSQLVIKNESYTTADASRPASNRGRILLDEIHITPWLLYTDKSEQVLHVGGANYTRAIINNTAGESGTLSYLSSNTSVATVDGNGEVTPVGEGYTTITASFTWSGSSDEVTTSYPIYVRPASNYETFSTNTTEHTYAVSGEITVAEDASTWKMNLAGVKHEDFNSNVAIVRAPRTDEDKKAYMQSSAISGGIKKLTFYWNLVGKEEYTHWDVRVLINGREVKRFTNETGGDLVGITNRQAEMTKCEINGINEPGNFVIRFENHSTVDGTYTVASNLNKGRFVIDNLFWESYNGTKTLAEDTENDTWIRNNYGTQTVAISRSALVGGVWNTLCLPFDLDKSELGAGADVQEMTSAVLNDNELTIGFTEHTDDNLEAGIPYLVKPASDVNISKEYTAAIAMFASPVVQGIVTLQGIFSPYAMKANDKSTLFVCMPDTNGDNLFYPSEDGYLKGFRAYFKIGEVTPGAGAPPIKRARFVVNQPGIATGIEETDSQQPAIRKVLRDGQLIIIRDGVEYNAMGQMIQ